MGEENIKPKVQSSKGRKSRHYNNRKYRSNKPKQEEVNQEQEFELNSWRTTSIFDERYFSHYKLLSDFTWKDYISVVCNPMEYNDLLRRISLVLYGSSGMYTNTVDYMTAMPTLDSVIVASGKNVNKKKRNKAMMKSALKTIKHKEFMRDGLFKGMVEGIAFYYFETTQRPIDRNKFLNDYQVDSVCEINDLGINASIISLPADYTQIVGTKNSRYVIAFNLSYFTNITGEETERKLRKFPKEIRDAYNERKQNGFIDGNWVVLDNTKTIVHKIRSKHEEKWGRPLVLSAIRDILYSDYFTDTKRNELDEINNKIIYQTLPEGQIKGTSALTKKQQEAQHNAVKGAVMSKNSRGGVSFFTVAAGTKIDSVDLGETDLFDESNETNMNDKIATDLGFAASLLNGTGSGSYSAQTNNLELVSSQIFMWIEQLEEELNKCINYNIIKDKNNYVEVRYLPITNVNKKNMVEYAKDLYLQGRGSLTLWASACGIAPDIFFSLLDEELENGYEDKYPVHKTSYNTSGNDEGGRPTSDDSGNSSTLETRSNGSNNAPKPSTR